MIDVYISIGIHKSGKATFMLLRILNVKLTKNAFILSTSQSTLYRRFYEASISSNIVHLCVKKL